jgi:preprotein translocase subunit SecA
VPALSVNPAYPERPDPPAGADKLVAEIGYLLHKRFARGPRDFLLTREAVRSHQARFARGPLAPRVPELRYQVKQGGLRTAILPELLALAACAVESTTPSRLDTASLGAAFLMLEGRMVDLDSASRRREAVLCAVIALAVSGAPVHVICASDFHARHNTAFMREALALTGFSVDCVTQGMTPQAKRAAYAADVVCGGHREIAHDFLRDRLAMGARRQGRMRLMLDRMSGDAPAADKLVMRGMFYAVVDDADQVLIDDARVPLVISAEADQSQERHLFEQAMELARGLRDGPDFELNEEGAALTAAGSGRLARLVQSLGGIWSGQQRREELVLEAITALYVLVSGRDYNVENGRVSLLQSNPEETGEDPAALQLRKKLIETKEGVALSGRRDVLGRISAPRFFSHYSHLCGICADARGLESDLWDMYRLKTERAAPAVSRQPTPVRMFATKEAKERALLQAIGHVTARGEAVVVALRTPVYTGRIMALLADSGIQARMVRGVGDAQEQAVLAAVHSPGSVTVTLHPAERNISPAGTTRVHLIVAELHDARRHMDRLEIVYDASGCELLLSLDEDILRAQMNVVDFTMISPAIGASEELSAMAARYCYRLVQRRIERAHANLRAEVMSFDQHLGDLLAFSGSRD